MKNLITLCALAAGLVTGSYVIASTAPEIILTEDIPGKIGLFDIDGCVIKNPSFTKIFKDSTKNMTWEEFGQGLWQAKYFIGNSIGYHSFGIKWCQMRDENDKPLEGFTDNMEYAKKISPVAKKYEKEISKAYSYAIALNATVEFIKHFQEMGGLAIAFTNNDNQIFDAKVLAVNEQLRKEGKEELVFDGACVYGQDGLANSSDTPKSKDNPGFYVHAFKYLPTILAAKGLKIEECKFIYIDDNKDYLQGLENARGHLPKGIDITGIHRPANDKTFIDNVATWLKAKGIPFKFVRPC